LQLVAGQLGPMKMVSLKRFLQKPARPVTTVTVMNYVFHSRFGLSSGDANKVPSHHV